MAESRAVSRRRALAAAGVGGVALAGYAAGARTADLVPGWVAGRDCDPPPLATGGTEWPFARHDVANTGTAPDRAALAWPVERAWTREWPVGGFFRLAPLTVADDVVLASIAGGGASGLHAFSLSDGAVQWRAAARNDRPNPVAAPGGVALFRTRPRENPPTVQARALGDGSLRWERPARSVASVADGRVVVTEPPRYDPGRLTAYDARTGDRCWRTTVGERPDDVVVDGGLIVLLRRGAGALALDAETGERRWRTDLGATTGASAGGRLVATRFPGELRGRSLGDGEELWSVTSEHYAPDQRTADGVQVARPQFDLGALTGSELAYSLNVVSDFPGRVQARDPATGDLLWDFGPSPDRTQDVRYSRPIRVGDDVLVTERGPDGDLSVIRVGSSTGRGRSRLQLGASHLLTPPVVAGGTLLLATGRGLVAYS